MQLVRGILAQSTEGLASKADKLRLTRQEKQRLQSQLAIASSLLGREANRGETHTERG